MTTADHIAAATAILDEARRQLETLNASPCGDDEVDGAIAGALDDIEGQIGVLHSFNVECCTRGADLPGSDFGQFLGVAGPGPTTDEIMALTRADD